MASYRLRRFFSASVLIGTACVCAAAGSIASPLPAPRGDVSPAGSIIAAAACSADSMPSDSYRAYVKGIQEELPAHGYDAGPPTGKLDGRTQAAIRRYQHNARLTADGCVSQALLDHLKFHLPKVYAAGKVPQANVAYAVQQELARRGYYFGAADGKAGPRTRQAAMRFQQDASIPATGVVDQTLLDKLRSADPAIRAR